MEMDRLLEHSLLERAKRVLAPSIVGGNFSRILNPTAPVGTPQFFQRALGTRLWDVEGREYIDLMCALGPNLLGYGEPRVEAAAERQRALGDTMTGPAPVLVELAEELVEMVSHADWALFAKTGTDALNAALLVARALTGKRRALMAKGSFHGLAPWCTPVTAGVLPEQRAHVAEYVYNDIASLEEAVDAAGNDLAAVFATAFKHDFFVDQELPRADYARRCRELCDRTGAVLIVDDVRAGFRLARDCTWSLVGVQPDLSCWSKAIANGYPIAALLGSERTREGTRQVAISGTYTLQAVPMAAAVATLQIIRESLYLEHTVELGQLLRAGLDEEARKHGFELSQTGPVQMPLVLFKSDPDLRFGMAFASAMMRRGVFFGAVHNMFLCAAMTRSDVDQIIAAAGSAFAELNARRSLIEPHEPLARMLKEPPPRAA